MIENGIIYITGTDAFDGTPVLDIKPYILSIDMVKSIRNELVEKELGLKQNNSAFISL
ncbi:MAG TPA: hypothetical protein DDW27_10260 [Bacteroidales bacterium]|nr:hypothetical protein [Bacteroidales bacterium]